MPAPPPGAELARRLQAALHQGRRDALAGYLVMQPDTPVEQLEAILDEWAAPYLADAPVNNPRENLRKNRLRPWTDRVAAIQAMM